MLRPLLTLCGALACALMMPTAVAARLTVPEHVEVDSINGQEVKAGLLKRSRTVELPDGPVLIELHYTDVQQAELGDSHTNFRSSPVAVSFVAAVGADYRVAAVRPANERQAAAYAQAPQLNIVRQDGGAVVQEFISAAELKQRRLRGGLTPQAPATTAPASGQGLAASATPASSSLAADNLWFWWQQADEPTRQAFLRRIRTQAD